jgi:peptide/nickel transport system substrate-binding protein
MEMEKKNLAIIILAVVLAVSGIGNVVLAVMTGFVQVEEEGGRVIIDGSGSNIAALDPLDTWDVPSHVAEHQVVEGLVDYNYSDHPNYGKIPKLATSWHFHSASEISFKLREGVWFHDGEKFDADAALWNFERLVYFCNYTGALESNETSWEAFPASLYFFSNGTPLFDHFVKNSEYNFTMFLKGPFAAIIDLLTFSATYMLSPKSTPRYKFLDLTKGKLIGTGPFKYIRFKSDVDVRFEVNPHYWGKSPWADKLIFRIIEDDTARMNAGLAGQFDYVGGVPKSYIPTFKSETGFHVEDVGQDLCYFYLEVYAGPPEGEPAIVAGQVNQKWSPEFRRALMLAINYTFIEQDILLGYAYKGTPAVPRAFGAAYNATVGGDIVTGEGGLMPNHYPFGTYIDNIEKAREYMMALYPTETAGLTITVDDGSNDAAWKALTLETLELNEHYGSSTHQQLNTLMTSDFDMIGLEVDITVRTWGQYLDTGENSPWEMDVGYIGWCPDYLDAFNMLDPLFNNQSGSCFSRVSDPYLLGLLTSAASETSEPARNLIYQEIQSVIFDVTRPINAKTMSAACHGSGWVYLVQQTHKTSLKGVAYNVMTMLNCWDWYIE